MNQNNQKWMWIGLVAAVVLGLLWQFYPLPNADDRIAKLPLSGFGYKGQDVPLTDFEKEFFKNVAVVKRVYKVGMQTFFITILDGTHNRHVVHDPYYCFQGSGWTITGKFIVPIDEGEAALVNLTKSDASREALYWYSDGTTRYYSPLHYWIQTTLRRLTLGLSGPEPLLIMVQPQDFPTADWEKFQENFPTLFEI